MDHILLCCYDSLALIKVRIYRDSEHSMLCAYSCYESHTEHIYKIITMSKNCLVYKILVFIQSYQNIGAPLLRIIETLFLCL